MAGFKVGDVTEHKSGSGHKVVILRKRILMRMFSGKQTYSVRWCERGEYQSGVAYEYELELIK